MKKNNNTFSNTGIMPASAGNNGFSEFIYEDSEPQEFDEFLREPPHAQKKRTAQSKASSKQFTNPNCLQSNVKRKKRKKAPEKFGLTFLGILYFSIVILNFIQPDRPTISENEKRELTKMPAFSYSTLCDGSYFDQLTLFFSDTFIFREKLVLLSRKIPSLYGISGNFSVLSNTDTDKETDSNISQKLEDELNRLQSEAPGTPAVTEPETEPPETQITSVSLSSTEISLPAGSTAAVEFTISGSEDSGISPTVTAGSDIISASISENQIIVSGLGEGTTSFTVNYGKASAVCAVTVTSITVSNNDGEADFLANGLFIYNGAVYTISNYGKQSVGYISRCLDYYKSLFPDTRISIMPAPVSSILIDNPEITEKFTSQKYILDTMQSRMSSQINFVNTYNEIFSHRTEYLYFKSDHHWTQLGAYYAYRAFAESVGFSPTPLSDMHREIINSSFNGSMYNFTGDERVKDFIDQVEVYYPTKPATMTVTKHDGSTLTYNRTIIGESGNYQAFIAGDNPYTVINVPDNPQNLSILVIKDSYGNALVPFLTEHYGNIIVIDPRYCDINIYDHFKDYGLTDILVTGNIQSQNSIKWASYYFACAGVDLDSLG